MIYTRPKKERKDSQKPTPSPHLQPNQSKSNNDNVLDPKCTLTHSKNTYMKQCKIAWFVKSESSKTLWFLSFHRVKNKHKEAALHSLLFFPTKDPYQLRRASLIEKGITHWTLKSVRIRCHKKVAFGQWSSIWFVDSLHLYKNNICLEDKKTPTHPF